MDLRHVALRLAAAVSVLAALAGGPAVTAAPAARPQAGFLVNTLNDLPDANLANPACETAGGQCSYRAAVQQANTTAGHDVISFSVTGTITYSTIPTTITDSVSIVGPGAALLTLNANNYGSVVRLSSTNPAASFAISGLTLTGGVYEGIGGGLDFDTNGATLVISGTVITGNLSVFGGGVALDGGPSQIINSLISHNQATLRGGGIDARSPVEIINTTIQENHQEAFVDTALAGQGVQGGSSAFTGGGLYTEATLTMTNSLVLSNSASMDNPIAAALAPAAPASTNGAGVYIYRALALIQSSRFEGNYFVVCITCTVAAGAPTPQRVGNGAGLYATGSLLTIRDSQFVNNIAEVGGGLATAGGSLDMARTLVADNQADAVGGVWADTTAVTLTDSLVRDNLASLNVAGGLYLQGGSGLISGSSFVRNHALLDGGGLYITSAPVTIVRSLIQENASGTGLVAGASVAEPQIQSDKGGGVYIEAASVTISDTAIVSNTATLGGAIGNGGNLTLRNVTVSGNAANRDGGGLYFFFPAPLAAEANAPAFAVVTANLLHTTLAGNVADDDNNGSGDGGGLFLPALTTAFLHSTLLATNLDRGGQKPECAGSVNSTGYNLVQSTTGCAITATTGDQFGQPAGLLPLQNNGGTPSTLTHGLALDSAALNTADPALCLPRDQRGALRPFGPGCDVGAFELAGLYIPIVTR